MEENTQIKAIPADVLTKLKSYIDKSKTQLNPYQVVSSPEDRQKLPKMGERTIGFVEKAYELAQENPKLLAGFYDADVYSEDFSDMRELLALIISVRQLEDMLNAIYATAGSKFYQRALFFYNSVKLAATQKLPGTSVLYKELKTRFPRHKGSSKTKDSIANNPDENGSGTNGVQTNPPSSTAE
jgi:hypothetical protein